MYANKQAILQRCFYAAGILFACLTAYFIVDYFIYTTGRDKEVTAIGQHTTEQLRNEVDRILVSIVEEGERLAELFSENEYSKEEVERIIKESSLEVVEIQGVTACFDRYAFSEDVELYCPYYNKGTSDFLMVEGSYDYTVESDPNTAWYNQVKKEGAKWVEPYYAKGSQDWYVDYGIPFYFSDGPRKGEVKGTITMSFIASGFKDLIHSLSLGKTGFGMISSEKGTFLAHPINEYVGIENIAHIKDSVIYEELRPGFEAMLVGESGFFEYFDEEQQDETFFFYDRIPSSKWSIGLLFYQNDLLDDGSAQNRRFIRIAIALSMLLIALLAIYFNNDELSEREIWSLSILTSILFVANILLVGYLEHTDDREPMVTESPPIVDNSSLNAFVERRAARSREMKTSPETVVPTGIFVKRMDFQDSYNLNIGGTIWQKYPLDKIDEVTIGFELPQMSPFAESSYIEESYRDTVFGLEGEEDYLLVGSEIRVTLRLNLDYGDFPLDKRHIDIVITPLDRQDRLIFTPDLGSYNYTNPFKKSGIDETISLSGSEVMESYFNFSLKTYDTDFGLEDKASFEEVPILHFNIDLRRVLLNSLVTYLIPIFVVLIMMFILVSACGKTNERQGIIESMAAFFFVLIFSHIDLRKEIETAELMYIEYFYFATYIMIVLSTFNLITYAKDKSDIFDYNENQLFKASYYPVFFLIILVVTMGKFY